MTITKVNPIENRKTKEKRQNTCFFFKINKIHISLTVPGNKKFKIKNIRNERGDFTMDVIELKGT